METQRKQIMAAGFIIGLVCSLALVALVIGGYIIAQRNSGSRPSRVGQRVELPPPAIAASGAPVTLAAAELLVWEPFDEDQPVAGGAALAREMQPGQFGNAVRLHIDNPLVYTVPGDAFLREATVMAWVRDDNPRDYTYFWCYSRSYPSAFYYPTHEFKLAMHFCRFSQSVFSATLAQTMQPGRYYHLAQTWGPGGFCTYLDGVPGLSETGNNQGNKRNLQSAVALDDALFLGGYPGIKGNESGPGWKLNQDGILVDDFAVFSRQLRPDEVAGIARGGVPLGDLLQ